MTKEQCLKIKNLFDKGYSILIDSGYVDGFICSMKIADKGTVEENSYNNIKEGGMFIESDVLASDLGRYSMSKVRIFKEVDINIED